MARTHSTVPRSNRKAPERTPECSRSERETTRNQYQNALSNIFKTQYQNATGVREGLPERTGNTNPERTPKHEKRNLGPLLALCSSERNSRTQEICEAVCQNPLERTQNALLRTQPERKSTKCPEREFCRTRVLQNASSERGARVLDTLIYIYIYIYIYYLLYKYIYGKQTMGHADTLLQQVLA